MISIDRSSAKDPRRSRRLFPPAISEDSWVLYHGTSDFNCAGIERDGLDPHRVPLPARTLHRLARIHRRLGWSTVLCRGLRTLDLVSRRSKPGIHLAESPLTALNFATRLYSGGEMIWGVRQAASELRAHGRTRGAPSWLRDELGFIADTEAFCAEFQARFRHGVIYAVRFRPRDLARMSLPPAKSVLYAGLIPPSRLVAKLILHPELDPSPWGKDPTRLRFFETSGGLGERLLERELSRQWAKALSACPERSASTARYFFTT